MDAEHIVMAERLPSCTGLMAVLVARPRGGQRANGAHFDAELKTVTIEHLDHEERELEPVYQVKVDDPAIRRLVRSSQGRAQGGWRLLRLADRRHESRGEASINVPPCAVRFPVLPRESPLSEGGDICASLRFGPVAPEGPSSLLLARPAQPHSRQKGRAPYKTSQGSSSAYPGLITSSMMASRSSNGRNADFIALIVNHRRSSSV